MTLCGKCGEEIPEAEHITFQGKKNGATCKACRAEYKAEYDRKRREYFKRQVLEFYGPECACCGESNPGFLSVDHINNDGAEDRKNRIGGSFWEHVVKNDFPEDLRILCFNCNMGRQFNGHGVCPHLLERK